MSVLGEVPEKLGGRRRANQEGLSTPLTILGSTGFSPLASDLHFSAVAEADPCQSVGVISFLLGWL
ncbi:hypothetical protein EMGR_002353 [Emarellia grisea]|jgi:hypothetical protein